jgi:hypothetical protein
MLPVHVGVELLGPAGQTLPHVLQFWGSLVVSEQVVPLQRVGLLPGQPLTHDVPSQTGVEPLHLTLHAPQLGDWVVFASHPFDGAPSQLAHPGAHDDSGKLHIPAEEQVTAPLTFARFVQSLPHVPQFIAPLCAQPPSLHERNPDGHPPVSIPVPVSAGPSPCDPVS